MSTVYSKLSFPVNLRASRHKLLRLLLHSNTQRGLFVDFLLRGVLADVLRDLHGAEILAAHRAEEGVFRAEAYATLFAYRSTGTLIVFRFGRRLRF